MGVTWADLDLGSKPHVHVRQQCYQGKVKDLKTAYSVRKIPLTPVMVDTLLAHRAKSYHGEAAPVWSTVVGTHLSSHNLRKHVSSRRSRTGLD